MSDRDRLRDLPSVDRLATAVARAELQARREELLNRCASTHRCSPPRATRSSRVRSRRPPDTLGFDRAAEPAIRALRLARGACATRRQRADRPALRRSRAQGVRDDVGNIASLACGTFGEARERRGGHRAPTR
jgi:hypothetical protein